eukprot:TRINITY_DN27905_c0_g1_i1.p1 TRINITY_DN27905_c0_g1~~TRINITY_DN27905_c0_g1_i1.p1  ORF type:complete len:207 (+),score=28.51 TRINITY_DN27905_c0_g1_i1:50-670(+)
MWEWLLLALVVMAVTVGSWMVLRQQGAGVVPFAVHNGEVLFLLHKTFQGAKKGTLIDWGGSTESRETPLQTAAREFVEETECMYFASDIPSHLSRKSEPERTKQIALVEELLGKGTVGYCNSHFGLLSYRAFFAQFPYRDLSTINKRFQKAKEYGLEKTRQLEWVTTEQLLEGLSDKSSTPLFVRLKNINNLSKIVIDINSKFHTK